MFSDPIYVYRGSMIGIDHQAATILVDTTSLEEMSDYFYNNKTIFKIMKTKNYRFYVKAIIDQTYYENIENYTFKYSNLTNEIFGVYYVSTIFTRTNFSISRLFNVTNCKFIISYI